MTRTIVKSAIVLGFIGAMWLSGTGPSTASGKGATLTVGAPVYQEVSYRRGYRSFVRPRRGGFERPLEDSARTAARLRFAYWADRTAYWAEIQAVRAFERRP
jgi:hypothetical protein